MIEPTKILLVGQTPPPFGGQAVMIENTLKGSYGEAVELHHVKMAFSKSMDQIGKIKFAKIIELFRVLSGIVTGRLKYGADVLYYFPAGPSTVPILRDMALLLPTRWMFRKVIFHFRASGLSEYYLKLPAVLRPVFRLVYFRPDIGIRLSEAAPEDPKILKARREYIIPNGIEDVYAEYLVSCERAVENVESNALHITYVGILSEGKGVKIFLQACAMLASEGISFIANLVGKFESENFENYARKFRAEHHIEDELIFHGVLTGCEKYRILATSDIFCFPSFFESETTPVAVLEALCFGLPVVATHWRGIPSIIEDEVGGFLVPIKDTNAVAQKLQLLIGDQDLRNDMGTQGRKRYLEKFTVDIYYKNMQRVFEDAV